MSGCGLRVGFAAALLLGGALPLWGQSLPKPVGCVSDSAHVMSPGAIAHLNQLCGQVERETHDRIDVVTVQTTDGEPIEQYVVGLQQVWKVGDREAMILVAVGQRQRWIAVESGLGTVFSPEELGKISGKMVPVLRSNDFDDAMTMAADELAAGMAQSAGVKMNLRLPSGAQAVAPAAVPAEARWLTVVTRVLVALLIVSFGVWVYASGWGGAVRRKMGKGMGSERK